VCPGRAKPSKLHPKSPQNNPESPAKDSKRLNTQADLE
jgi:hypothetical protein